MNSADSIHIAFANMLANKARSVLSMMGIVIGTASVILVISIVNGTRQAALSQMKAGKENMLTIQSAYDESSGRIGKINLMDIEKLKQFPTIKTAFPLLSRQTKSRGTFGRSDASVTAVDQFYPQLYQMRLVAGRFFTQDDIEGRPHICVVSEKLAHKLFGFDYPIGQYARFTEGALEVVGVFKTEKRLEQMGVDASVLVPMNTAIQMFNTTEFDSVQIRVFPKKMDEAKEQIINYINMEKKGKELAIIDVRDELKETEKTSKGWLLQMVLVASISLLVGGVGLMNVMLTTVAERTHEIGLRKALGADSKNIQRQFLVESVMLSGAGGLIGVFLGVFLSYAVNISTKGRVLISILPLSLIISYGFSLITGVLFGLFPASKAAHLSPVEALRYE